MMAFITHCLRSGRVDLLWRGGLACAMLLFASLAWAQNAVEVAQFRTERADDEILATYQVQFDLPSVVEDALVKGIPMYFVAEADVLRERWYWYDKRVGGAQRSMRLAYQPLTRHWRLNVSTGANAPVSSQGLALTQSFDTLAQALAAIKRLSRWKIVDATDLDPTVKYKVEFRFRLDLTQLPRPFQIGALGQSDWDISIAIATPLSTDVSK